MSSRIAIHSGSTSLTQYDRSDLYMIREDSSSPVSDIVDNPCATDITNDFLASSGAIVLGVGKKGEEQKQRWRRLQEFDAWIWSSFYSDLNAVKHGKRTYLDSLARCESCHDLYWRDEKHCKTCHTTFELDFDLEEKYAIHIATCREKEDNDMFPKHKVLSSQLQSLKAAIHAIEVGCHLANYFVFYLFATYTSYIRMQVYAYSHTFIHRWYHQYFLSAVLSVNYSMAACIWHHLKNISWYFLWQYICGWDAQISWLVCTI